MKSGLAIDYVLCQVHFPSPPDLYKCTYLFECRIDDVRYKYRITFCIFPIPHTISQFTPFDSHDEKCNHTQNYFYTVSVINVVTQLSSACKCISNAFSNHLTFATDGQTHFKKCLYTENFSDCAQGSRQSDSYSFQFGIELTNSTILCVLVLAKIIFPPTIYCL